MLKAEFTSQKCVHLQNACHDCSALAEETRRGRSVPKGASPNSELLVNVLCSGQVSVNVDHVGLSRQDHWACDSESEGLKFVETSTPMALHASESL